MSLRDLSVLLPLPDEELQQIIGYAKTLSKAEAADHFGNLLGDSPLAVEFIANFNSAPSGGRPPPALTAPSPQPSSSTSSLPLCPTAADVSGVPKSGRGGGGGGDGGGGGKKKKKKAAIHTPAPRQVLNTNAGSGTVYNKKDQDEDYMTARPRQQPTAAPAETSLRAPIPQKPKLPPSAMGSLVSEITKGKPRSTPVSRTPTPASSSKIKVSVTGGTPMHGASTAISDLDAAIRSLEVTTNPTLSKDPAARRCNCLATRHPLQTAAPNCLNCGKVICLKEGLGPCTDCGEPLLDSAEVQAMIRELKADRGRERMAADREVHRRPDISRTPAPFTKPRGSSEALSAAEAHRDKLLGFQAQNAKRTTVRDEAADFDYGMATGGAGNMWSTPEQRAQELKRQQKVMREMEWNARPDYEKRSQVVSIDLVGRKVVKKMAPVERPVWDDDVEDDDGDGVTSSSTGWDNSLQETSGNEPGTATSGTFSRNPLLGGLIRPVYDDVKGKSVGKGKKPALSLGNWSRMDYGDDEDLILDGEMYGDGDEPACG